MKAKQNSKYIIMINTYTIITIKSIKMQINAHCYLWKIVE